MDSLPPALLDFTSIFRPLLRAEVEEPSRQLPSHHRLSDYAISLDPLPRTHRLVEDCFAAYGMMISHDEAGRPKATYRMSVCVPVPGAGTVLSP
jgi:hypothetical protein